MSEDFDEEAERRRLREKYESDREKRETTERMSQLLLQGATMTNKHCDTCGSPIFRYQGQEFCPTCQAEAGTEAAGGDGQPRSADATAGESQSAGADEQPTDESSPAGASTGGAETETVDAAERPARGRPTGTADGEQPAADTASAALTETIRSLAVRARQSEDPRQAKALLEAAHEAAETLSTLPGR